MFLFIVSNCFTEFCLPRTIPVIGNGLAPKREDEHHGNPGSQKSCARDVKGHPEKSGKKLGHPQITNEERCFDAPHQSDETDLIDKRVL